MKLELMYDGALATCSGADRKNLTFSTNLKESPRGVEFVQENGPERVNLKLSPSMMFPMVSCMLQGKGLGTDKENTHLLPVTVELLEAAP